MYILTLSNGKRVKFYVKACAELFKQSMGGNITSE